MVLQEYADPCKVRSEDVILIFPTLVYRVHSAN